jgi:hypothetical protein
MWGPTAERETCHNQHMESRCVYIYLLNFGETSLMIRGSHSFFSITKNCEFKPLVTKATEGFNRNAPTSSVQDGTSRIKACLRRLHIMESYIEPAAGKSAIFKWRAHNWCLPLPYRFSGCMQRFERRINLNDKAQALMLGNKKINFETHIHTSSDAHKHGT